MLDHHIVSGLIPQDGQAISTALNEASVKGYSLLSTTCCAIDEANAFYIATFGKPVADAPKRGIGMGGGGPRPRPEQPHVDASPTAQSENP